MVVFKELILTVCALGAYGGLERTDFLTICTFGGCGGLEELIFNSLYFWRVWWS